MERFEIRSVLLCILLVSGLWKLPLAGYGYVHMWMGSLASAEDVDCCLADHIVLQHASSNSRYRRALSFWVLVRVFHLRTLDRFRFSDLIAAIRTTLRS